MAEAYTIPPKDEWINLTTSQLYELKGALTNRYYDLRAINASFADQYLKFTLEADVYIGRLEQIRRQEALDAQQQ